MALVSSPTTGSHGRFTLRKPQLPLFTCGPPQSQGWQFASSDRCKSRSPFPFFNPHSPKLSYPIPRTVFHFFTLLVFYFFLFAPRFIEDWLLGFHVLAKFLIWVAFLTTQLKSGLVSHLQLLSLLVLHQFSLVALSCPIVCDPMNRSTPGLPVHHQLLEFTQTHVHWVSNAVQASHPLLVIAIL